jgi:hypothetical protein
MFIPAHAGVIPALTNVLPAQAGIHAWKREATTSMESVSHKRNARELRTAIPELDPGLRRDDELRDTDATGVVQCRRR